MTDSNFSWLKHFVELREYISISRSHEWSCVPGLRVRLPYQAKLKECVATCSGSAHSMFCLFHVDPLESVDDSGHIRRLRPATHLLTAARFQVKVDDVI